MTIEQDHDRTRLDEQAILCATIERADVRERAKAAGLQGAHFYSPDHQHIWDAMVGLDRAGEPVDFVILNGVLIGERAQRLLPDILTAITVPDHIEAYVARVRKSAVSRQMMNAATRVMQQTGQGTVDAEFTQMMAEEFAALSASSRPVVDDGSDIITADEILSDNRKPLPWVIPGLLRQGERMILTGEEGLGKSHLLRQFAVHSAAGINPFDPGIRIEPVRSLIMDYENGEDQLIQDLKPMVAWCAKHARMPNPFGLHTSGRIDITDKGGLAEVHRRIDLWQPNLLIIGPIYRLTRGSVNDDDAAGPVLAALDTIRDRGIAMMIEAHSGKGDGNSGKGYGTGKRVMEPIGSSAFLRWPEFGYGLRANDDGTVAFAQWRGPRALGRDWPRTLRGTDDGRWVPYEMSPR